MTLAQCHYAELDVVMLSVVMLSVVLLSVIMQCVVVSQCLAFINRLGNAL